MPTTPAVASDTIETKQKSWMRKLVDKAVKATIRLMFKTLYRAKISGMDKFDKLKGERMVIIANHVSMLDGALLASTLPVEPAFAIDATVYETLNKKPFMRFILSCMDMFPMDRNKPQAIKALADLAKSGRPVMIFPEGRLTSSGTLMQVFDGAGMVAHNADAKIVPIYLSGLQDLPRKHTRVKSGPTKRFPKLSVTVLEPTKLVVPEGLNGRQQRAAQHEQMEKIMHELPLMALDKEQGLIDALHDTVGRFGRDYKILDDVNARETTYGEVMDRAYVVGGYFRDKTEQGENVGVLLPNSTAAAVTFWGLQAIGRVPAILNAKAEIANMMHYTQIAQLKTIITSRKLVEMAQLEGKIEELSKKCKIVYLEDVKGEIGLADKLKATARARGILPRFKERSRGDAPAVILFTSGSEGVPKGVVLSSNNLISNMTQVKAVAPFTSEDKIFNAMPVFHSFGLSGGLILPMLSGIQSFQYPTPLDGKNIPKAAYFYDATIMFGTNTFLNLYAANATDEDFGASLRTVYAGAEALSKATYDMYNERFEIQIHAGYGMTEAAPVVSMNVRGAHKTDTVGKFLPGIEARYEPVPGVNGSLLHIKGPNVMLGYLKHDNPGVIQPPPDGWHPTGDIVSLDESGFVKLTGRMKRFAKIGGEMVSLDVLESIAREAKPDTEHAMVLKQDPLKGDSVILFTTDAAIKRDDMTQAAQRLQQSVLGLPKNNDIVVLKDLPKLPTGKTDYVTLGKSLEKPVANDNGATIAMFNASAAQGNTPAVEIKPDVIKGQQQKNDGQKLG